MLRPLALAMLLATPAAATPPQVVTATDTAFGITATHLFVLRRVTDNRGLYTTTATQTHLVSIRLENGRTDTIWPVYGFLEEDGADGTPEGGATAEVMPLPGAVDPFAVLAHAGARHVAPTEDFPADATLDAEGLRIEAPDGAIHALDAEPLFARMRDGLDRFATALPPDSILNGLSGFGEPTGAFLAQTALTSSSCNVAAIVRIRPLLTWNAALIARVRCGDEEEPGIVDILTPVPQVAPPPG